MGMTRKPDEIKKGLECCSNVNFVCNEECPYYKSLSEGEDCCLKKNADALVYIQQLEAKNVELSGKIGQLEAERDAVVETIKQLKRCADCKHATIIGDGAFTWVDCPKRDGRCSAKSLWEWSGAPKEE